MYSLFLRLKSALFVKLTINTNMLLIIIYKCQINELTAIYFSKSSRKHFTSISRVTWFLRIWRYRFSSPSRFRRYWQSFLNNYDNCNYNVNLNYYLNALFNLKSVIKNKSICIGWIPRVSISDTYYPRLFLGILHLYLDFY